MKTPRPNGFFSPRNTLRFKVSVWYVAIIGVVLIFIQAVLYFNYVHSMAQSFDAQLQMKAEQIGGAINTFREMLGDQHQALSLAADKALDLSIQYPNYVFMPESPQKFWMADARKLGLDKDYLLVMDAKGQVITKSPNVTGRLAPFLKKIGTPNSYTSTFYKFKFNKTPLRIIVVPYYYTFNQGYEIVVGSSYTPVEGVLAQHLEFIVISTVVFLVIASLIVRFFVIRVLSSVMEISEAARSISQENLHARIKLTHTDAEIDHLTGSLNNMIERLEKSFGDIKEFSLEMAHEVKTPLAIISGESQLALQEEHSPQDYQKVFRTILKEAKRTQGFVSDLLLLTKLDYRLVQFRFETIDLGSFLHEICGEMRLMATAQEIELQENIASGEILIKGDKIHLRRVFYNLIDNALKFTPPGGRISMLAKQDRQKAICEVSDTGCGIAQDELSKIFYKFYCGSAHGSHEFSGCGLGLSIVHSIIMLHGGSIQAQSQLGYGSSFTMEFPLAR